MIDVIHFINNLHVTNCFYLWFKIGEGNGNPLQYSCLENPMDRGAWQTTVHGVAKGRTQLKQFSMHAWFKITSYSVKYLLRVNRMFLLAKFWKCFSKLLLNFILISVWGSYWLVTNTIIFNDFAFIMQNSESFEWFLWVLCHHFSRKCTHFNY